MNCGPDSELMRLRAENERLLRRIETQSREIERWRHGAPIEGDFVCPHELELTAAKSTLESCNRARKAAEAENLAIAAREREECAEIAKDYAIRKWSEPRTEYDRGWNDGWRHAAEQIATLIKRSR